MYFESYGGVLVFCSIWKSIVADDDILFLTRIFPAVGRAGVPMEVMGLMLGEFVDEYTVRVVDVFAMPQSGTGVSVEAVDHVFQTNMLDMLKQTGRYANVFMDGDSLPFFGPRVLEACNFLIPLKGSIYFHSLFLLMNYDKDYTRMVKVDA